MNKQLLSAVIGSVMMMGTANAALPTIDPDTTEVYLSGASASLDFIKKLITSSAVPAQDRICDAAQPIWTFQDTIDAKTQHAFYCTKASGNSKLANAKSHLLIYKRSEGGSAMGVNPLVNNEGMSFLRVKGNPSCAQVGTSTTVNCGYDKTLQDATKFNGPVAADFGMSDVDPVQFTGENTPDGFSAVTADDVSKLTVQGASVVVFGQPVTISLYKALQAAQKFTGKIASTCAIGDRANQACMPSLTSAQIASLHAGSWASWNSLKVGTTGKGLATWVAENSDPAISALAPAVSDVHVCRRVNGSGTQAQSNLVFLNYPCANASSATLAAHDFGTNEGDGFPLIHELSASGGVDACLNELNTGVDTAGNDDFDNTAYAGGTRWAVGIQSLEKGMSSTGVANSNYEFVKVDGVAPTLANVVNGSYKDWVENTFQFNSDKYNNQMTPDVKSVVDAVIYSSALPEVMAALNSGFVHGFGTGSFLAVPTLFAPEANGALNTARPVSPYSRATASASVENCRVPTIYSSGDSSL